MVTDRDLREWVAVLNRRLGTAPGDPGYLVIEWAYGRPRLYDKGGARELSPRLPNGEMHTFLQGMSAGLDSARQAVRTASTMAEHGWHQVPAVLDTL